MSFFDSLKSECVSVGAADSQFTEMNVFAPSGNFLHAIESALRKAAKELIPSKEAFIEGVSTLYDTVVAPLVKPKMFASLMKPIFMSAASAIYDQVIGEKNSPSPAPANTDPTGSSAVV